MEKYRIVRWEKFSKNGQNSEYHFYVEKRRKFFGRTYWLPIRVKTTKNSRYGTGFQEKVTFSYLGEAERFIEEILVLEKPYDTEVNTVMKVY